VLVGAAFVVGLTSGLGVWVFKRLIDLFHSGAFGGFGTALSQYGNWLIFLVPALGGLLVGLLLYFFVGEERHHGVAGIMEAVALSGGRLRYRRAPAKIIGAALSIGVGASVGPEDPSVQIGANLGSLFGRTLRLSDDRVRTLVAAGAAGGIAAAFNAPIAGVFFALELILGELSAGAMGAVVAAAVLSSVVTQALSGTQPAFRVPAYAFNSVWELPLYLGLGLLAGPLAALYIRALYAAQDVFHSWVVPRWVKPAAAGLIVGVCGIFLPQIFGVGYDTIEKILGSQPFALTLLIALLVAKLLMTAVSIGGGFPGGVFAPSIFLGATLGGAYGLIAAQLFPALHIVPGAFAMVGMAAVLAGSVHAPLTAIILLFEMTNDYHIILPLMFAVMVSLVISRLLVHDSVYSLGLARKGIRLQQGRDVEVLEGITVDEIMQTEVTTLLETDPISRAADIMLRMHHHGLPVVTASGDLVGIISISDVEAPHNNGDTPERTVGEVCTRDLQVVFPDETLAVAMRRMAARDVGRLPVVARDNPRQLVGMLRRTDMIQAYELALTRRASMRHRAHQVRLGAFIGMDVHEVVIREGAPCAGKRVSEVAWPRDCVLATLRRGRQVMIPRGDTVLKPGDVLVAVVEGPAREELRRLCSEVGQH
jgi:CIC family chloride channel protein